jgi:glutaredoxin
MTKLVIYSRSTPCAFVQSAKRVLDEQRIDYSEIYIDVDIDARQHVLDWTGFASVPTIVLSTEANLPIEAPVPLEKGASPRGIDRGSMITEPTRDELLQWLQKHSLLAE